MLWLPFADCVWLMPHIKYFNILNVKVAIHLCVANTRKLRFLRTFFCSFPAILKAAIKGTTAGGLKEMSSILADL